MSYTLYTIIIVSYIIVDYIILFSSKFVEITKHAVLNIRVISPNNKQCSFSLFLFLLLSFVFRYLPILVI